MKVIYTDKPGNERGVCYRRLDQFFGVIDSATEVQVEGDAQHITDAYQQAGIKIGSAQQEDQPETDPHNMKVPELKEWLTGQNIAFDASAKKEDLQALIPPKE
ncbi:HeH/LEM domain-containing protein [Pseudomonas capsici]|uniref:HeH/LEM domain-containing protein n=1 Tax=Pseudomonas capsici TaxID=2810614 RepID=UPI0021F0D90E|nr:HeH/LEM domain-containing protein [Pseudomonas capsici]MCV4287873.1 HeH/LEM domain-containing protein [Pseudomonas capsici]